MPRNALWRFEPTLDLVTRRVLLRAGALAMGGLTMADVLRLRAESPAPGRQRPKSAILIFLSGGPSHVDLYDMKPQAPREYRGEFTPIRTSVPGIEICELMPMQAKIAERFTILRGFQGGHLHTANEFFSGYPWQESPRASIPGEARRPAIGSVVSRLQRSNVPIPPYVSIRSQHQWERAYYLGTEHEPFRIAENSGNIGTESLANMSRQKDVTPQRLEARRDLLRAVDACRRDLDFHATATAMDAFQGRALDIIASSHVRDAFDIEKEPKEVRARYGEGLDSVGQEPWKWLLQARRLIEAGVTVVTVCTYGWDTHRTNFKSLREMVPSLDMALHALITDLDERGLLDDVVVLMGGEFGRTPRIGDLTPDGRGHWPDAGFLWIAGGGLKTGQIIGATDRRGERVIGSPIRMQNVLTTVYGCLGIDPATAFPDHNGRPQYVLEDREPVPGLV
jgi:hypothetical protein